MLDGRIYRMSLIAPALALLVLAFSLTPRPAALHATLSPIAFDGSAVNATMRDLAARYPHRTAGSESDRRIAGRVASSLARSGFTVSSDLFAADTVHGRRVLENVIATRAGAATGAGSVVVVAPRDGPGVAGMSGTAMLLELGRVLGGEALDRGIVLASVSGGEGAAGVTRLAARLPRPVDAVVVLGDVASVDRAQPYLVPWGADGAIAPPRLLSTLSGALAGQAGIHAATPGALSQVARLAFPFTVSAQGPFVGEGLPAVDLSLSGERGPSAAGAAVGAGALGGIGQGVLAAITALDSGRSVGAPAGNVLFDGEIVPGWAIALFVLALIVPVALVLIDGLARARRRRYPVVPALAAIVASAAPFVCAGLVLVIGGALGGLPTPPGPTDPGAMPVTGGAVAVMAVALLVGLGTGILTHVAFVWIGALHDARPAAEQARAPRPMGARPPRRRPDRPDDGTGIALGLVLLLVALLLWFSNPLAALLLVPALHLWVWGVDGDLRVPGGAWTRGAMLALGALPTAAIVLSYGHALGFGLGQLAYEAVLLLAGHIVSWAAAVEWALALGCLVTAAVLVVAQARRPAPAVAPITVRGPLGYAGPGSLGGTKSALRR
ncbi:MAG TPA: hypothetical protein VKV21_06120 [Solirubrobacteraceae bacterium]|nr:hypothetical protein [Solirubrobacteraceae bacterium]